MNKKFIPVLKTVTITVLLFLILILGIIVIFTGSREIGGFRLYTVASGSMEPAIPTGSLILTSRSSKYISGDIVTYRLPSNYQAIVTHRIIEETTRFDRPAFILKGDANDSPDPEVVPVTSIIGKYVIAIPYIGYVIEFARTPLGVMLLIVVPGTIILWEESKNMYRILRNLKRKE